MLLIFNIISVSKRKMLASSTFMGASLCVPSRASRYTASKTVMAALKQGDKITDSPEYFRKLKVNKGGMKALSDYNTTRATVIFFYPKAATPGCTKEACSFRDSYAVFKDAGATVVGVSGDDVAAQEAFAKQNNLPFDLLCDVGDFVRKGFGIPSDLFGVLPGRQTYVVDNKSSGKVVLSFNSQLDTEGHIKQALNAIKSLN